MRNGSLAILISVGTSASLSTPQIPDTLLVNGERAPIFSAPLLPVMQDKAYQARLHPLIGETTCSGSWHGFRAHWALEAQQLILLSIESEPCSPNPRPIPLQRLFGSRPSPIVADWYSGRIVLPRGEIVKHDHFSGQHQYERYRVIGIVKGAVVSDEEREQLP